MAEAKAREHPTLVQRIMRSDGESGEGLVFRPAPPGDAGRLALPTERVEIALEEAEFERLLTSLTSGALTRGEVDAVLLEAKSDYGIDCPADLRDRLLDACRAVGDDDPFGTITTSHAMEDAALVAVKVVDRIQKALLDIEPLTEVRFEIAVPARLAVRIGWEAMAKHGRFPLPPQGESRFERLRRRPAGMLHFVSASDSDAGYIYTMGIALSPAAQALEEMDLNWGLDGELIVPGQAVAPIPPTLAMATRLFAASIPTSSNISEDIQSIPYSNFAHPHVQDIAPARGYLFRPKRDGGVTRVEEAQEEIEEQLARYRDFVARTPPEDRAFLPEVGAALDITDLGRDEMVALARAALDGVSAPDRAVTALFLLLRSDAGDAAATDTEFAMTPRVEKTCQAIDVAVELGLRYVAVCDESEDEWLPNLLEYFTASELDYLADYSDERSIILCDGRPVDPMYTASTAAQRIQSVFTSLSVDILKMGMWLCLDALSARRVWRELRKNPHIPERMLLMPIGIVEPYSAFVDNRDRNKTPRPILDPFDKIKFMIEEARILGAPSLLTDTRHKDRWVLLGSIDGDLAPHVREPIGAIPLIGRETFMACEGMAREAGILLGQAGSIEADQIFWIMSEITLDAAKRKSNPATAIWTAETERVLRRADGSTLRGDLQSQRRAAILPYLAVVNRTFESHATINGWLEYLEEAGQGDEELRGHLLAQREAVLSLQEACLVAQSALSADPGSDDADARAAYESAWQELRTAFAEYHGAIKEAFADVQERVASAWGSTS